MINYWAVPNMGKMHMMISIEMNKKTYVKHGGKHYFYKQWHDPDNYNKRIEMSYVCRKGQSKIEKPIKTKTTAGEKSDAYTNERHEYLDLAAKMPIDSTKLHSNTSEVGGELMMKFFGSYKDRKPPEEFMKDKDPVEVFFTDKHWRGLQKVFPVSPSGSYFGTFLEPYVKNDNQNLIMTIVDELLDCDILMSPFMLMGKYMLGHPDAKDFEKTELEAHCLKTYKSIKNVVPYKENLVDCFASKLKRIKKYNVLEEYKKDKRRVWSHLDGIVRNVRRIEKYLQDNKIDPVYFNLDRDDYKETFGFEKNISRINTHPGYYPEREEFEKIAKEYVTMRDMRDMRRRNRLRDWI